MKNRPTGRFLAIPFHEAYPQSLLCNASPRCFCSSLLSAAGSIGVPYRITTCLFFDPWKVILEYFICSHDCHWHYLAFALCGNLESTFFERLYLCQVIFVFAACALRKYTYADAGFDLIYGCKHDL